MGASGKMDAKIPPVAGELSLRFRLRPAVRVLACIQLSASPPWRTKRQGTVLCLDCVFSAVGESEEQRALREKASPMAQNGQAVRLFHKSPAFGRCFVSRQMRKRLTAKPGRCPDNTSHSALTPILAPMSAIPKPGMRVCPGKLIQNRSASQKCENSFKNRHHPTFFFLV